MPVPGAGICFQAPGRGGFCGVGIEARTGGIEKVGDITDDRDDRNSGEFRFEGWLEVANDGGIHFIKKGKSGVLGGFGIAVKVPLEFSGGGIAGTLVVGRQGASGSRSEDIFTEEEATSNAGGGVVARLGGDGPHHERMVGLDGEAVDLGIAAGRGTVKGDMDKAPGAWRNYFRDHRGIRVESWRGAVFIKAGRIGKAQRTGPIVTAFRSENGRRPRSGDKEVTADKALGSGISTEGDIGALRREGGGVEGIPNLEAVDDGPCRVGEKNTFGIGWDRGVPGSQ